MGKCKHHNAFATWDDMWGYYVTCPDCSEPLEDDFIRDIVEASEEVLHEYN